MYKGTCIFTIVLLLIAGPVLGADRCDDRPTGLRAALAWVLDLVGYGDVKRAAPEARQKAGVEVIIGGETAPPDDGGDQTRHGDEVIIGG